MTTIWKPHLVEYLWLNMQETAKPNRNYFNYRAREFQVSFLGIIRDTLIGHFNLSRDFKLIEFQRTVHN